MSSRWRAYTNGDNHLREYDPFSDFPLRRFGSIQEEVLRTSMYLEHQRFTLQCMKNQIEKLVYQHVMRSRSMTGLHMSMSGHQSTPDLQAGPHTTSARAYNERPAAGRPGTQRLPDSVKCAKMGLAADGCIRQTAMAMTSPRVQLKPISVDLNGAIYDTANGDDHHRTANEITSSPQTPETAPGPSSVKQGNGNSTEGLYSYGNGRRRFRSPMNAGGLSSRSSESSSSSTFIEAIAGHQEGKGDATDITLDSDGMVASGSLPALLKLLMPSKDYYPDKSYIFAFLLSARLFISPMDILHEIIQHCIFEQNAKGDNFRRETRAKFFQNVLKLMSEWTETFPYDFRNEKMKERLKLLLELCCGSSDPSLRGYKGVLLQNVANKVSKLERYENALMELQRDHCTTVQRSEIFSGVAEKCSNPSIVAQQLTHIELERLSMIGPEEFIHAFSRECSSIDTTHFLLNQLTNGVITVRNIEHYVDWCNRLSRLVATEICRHTKKKQRVRVIEFFIDVAKECFNMGNFNSLMAIVGGMDMSAVSRLKRTWAKVDVSKLAILEHQLDPSGNFLSYRSTLKAAVWRSAGATKDSEKIIVPFFSLLWKDLLASYEGCAKRLPNGHINLAMFSQFARQVKQFIQWKEVECPFGKNDSLLQYILTSPTFNEKALHLASFDYEPAETQAEKELLKSLKYVSTLPQQ